MSNHYQLQNYHIEFRPDKKQLLVLIAGWKGYYDVLTQSFPTQCKKIFTSKKIGYDWGVFIDWKEDDNSRIVTFLDMLLNVICINNSSLRQLFALGHHFHRAFEGSGRTIIGEQIYQSKPYQTVLTPQHIDNARILGIWFTSFFRRHPAYYQSDYIIAVPYSGKKSFDLPEFIVNQVCQELKINNGNGYVLKNPTANSTKDLKSLEERQANIRDAFVIAETHPFTNKLITIVDDIYDTGSTVDELAKTLKMAGATVQAVVGSKINRVQGIKNVDI
jgi:translation initiation factor 1 (eIF-1/SUI1)